ncbi:MAG TPA: hypothetical protein VD996_06360 [Chitinophagaceae bacterium]|nr:hypothetical protein [Chitinophagaceae bacterium]
MKRLPLLFTIIFFLAACGDNYICPKDPLFPAFINYSTQDIDTIYLEVYQKGTNFSTRLNTIRLDRGNTSFEIAGDTAKMFMGRIADRLTDEYDYRFVNPTDNKKVSVTDLKYTLYEGRRGGLFGWDSQDCNSPLVSYKRDGVEVIVPAQNIVANFVYITK